LMYSAFSYYCESWLLLYWFLLFCCMWSIIFLLSFQCELRLFSFCEFHIFLCLCWLYRNITNFLLNILWLFLNLSLFVFNLFAFIGLNILVNYLRLFYHFYCPNLICVSIFLFVIIISEDRIRTHIHILSFPWV